MGKPLSGKKLFEAMGRRAYTQGLPITYERAMRNHWPMWARSAWARGWLYQQPARAQPAPQPLPASHVDELDATIDAARAAQEGGA